MTPESDVEPATSWRRATILACVASLMLVSVALVSLGGDGFSIKRIEVPTEITQCAGDSECVLVNKIGCCPCQSGGAQWSINKDAADMLRRFLKRTCRKSAVCTRINACRDDLAPACVSGRCITKIANG
jgi:hypothetical protein